MPHPALSVGNASINKYTWKLLSVIWCLSCMPPNSKHDYCWRQQKNTFAPNIICMTGWPNAAIDATVAVTAYPVNSFWLTVQIIYVCQMHFERLKYQWIDKFRKKCTQEVRQVWNNTYSPITKQDQGYQILLKATKNITLTEWLAVRLAGWLVADLQTARLQ